MADSQKLCLWLGVKSTFALGDVLNNLELQTLYFCPLPYLIH
jgi:hypothetical protein